MLKNALCAFFNTPPPFIEMIPIKTSWRIMMKRSMVFVFAAALLVIVGLAVSTGAVLAQQPTPTGTPFGYGHGSMMGGGHGGMMNGSVGGYGVLHTYMRDAIAAKLGITVEEYDAALAAGKTCWDLAAEKGYTLEQTQQLLAEARTAALAKAVADGVITQEQADWMNLRMSNMGNGTGGCQGGGYGGGMGRGGRWNQTQSGDQNPVN